MSTRQQLLYALQYLEYIEHSMPSGILANPVPLQVNFTMEMDTDEVLATLVAKKIKKIGLTLASDQKQYYFVQYNMEK